ncbi:MAG: glycosyltransferase family 4 protein [Roseinatronobacter sp.]|nr:glycosyltransferase family 4 protein [Roseinatronobacter sp.]
MTFLILASSPRSLCNFRGSLIEAILARGHTVHACAPGLLSDQPTRDWLEARGVTCHDAPFARTGLNPISDLRALLHLTRLMRRVRPDVCLGYTIKPVIWGLLAARLVRVPRRVALITGLGYAFTGQASGKRAVIQHIARRLYKLALRGAHMIVFQNHDDPADMSRHGILPRSVPVEVVNGSGVDLAAFPPRDLPDGPIQFLLIARLLGDKGIREYAAAAAMLAPRWPGVGFHLVGGLDPNPDGIARDEVEGWVRAGHMIWHGPLDEVRAALAACHVYVLPSYREGTPRTVLEAMATGRAIITTDAPGCRETVEDGQNGFLVSVRDCAALAGVMERFLVTPGLVARMGAASRGVAAEKYDLHKVNTAMLRALRL